MSNSTPLKASKKSWTERIGLTLIAIVILALLASIMYSPVANSLAEPNAGPALR